MQYNIAVIDEAQGKYDDAIQILNQLAAEDRALRRPNTPLATRIIAPYFWSAWERSIARPTRLNWPTKLSARCSTLGDENAVRGYQQIIETYRDNKQWQLATNVAEEAAKKFPNDRGLQMVAASQQADMGNAGPAIEHVKSLLKGNPPTIARFTSRWPRCTAG